MPLGQIGEREWPGGGEEGKQPWLASVGFSSSLPRPNGIMSHKLGGPLGGALQGPLRPSAFSSFLGKGVFDDDISCYAELALGSRSK